MSDLGIDKVSLLLYYIHSDTSSIDMDILLFCS
jgi:hypothetical protein